MEKLPNLLIIAGTGRNSGKTTLVCNIISQNRVNNIIAVKISPHEHSITESSVQVMKGPDWEIFLENSTGSNKDTARMLAAGASRAYYIRADEGTAGEAFGQLLEKRESAMPVICESPVLRNYFDPGLFIIADSKNVINRKELTGMVHLADLIVEYESGETGAGFISFRNGGWLISR